MSAEKASTTVRKARRDYNSFKSFISVMCNDADSGVGMNISGLAVGCIDSAIRDMIVKITNEASTLSATDHRDTITPRDVASAVQLLYPGELGRNAAEATRAPVAMVLGVRTRTRKAKKQA